MMEYTHSKPEKNKKKLFLCDNCGKRKLMLFPVPYIARKRGIIPFYYLCADCDSKFRTENIKKLEVVAWGLK